MQSSSLPSNPPSTSTAIIEKLFIKLKAYLDEWHPDEDFQKVIKIVSSSLQKETLSDFEANVNAGYLLKTHSDWHLGPFYISCAYAITIREGGSGINEIEGWTLITQAFFLLGKAEGLIDKESQRDFQKSISNSSKGGEIRASRLGAARIECARLLQAKKPPGGWPSEAAAIENIKPALLVFIADRRLQFVPHLLELNIKKWLKTDAGVVATFVETRSKEVNWK